MVLKRKQSNHGVCIVPKKIILPKKAPTKADLSEELKLIKQLNEAMEEDIQNSDKTIAILEKKELKNLETIKILQEKVFALEKNKKSSLSDTELKSEGTQTELEVPIFCYECDFPAEDYHDLGEHMMEFHAFVCKTCGENFESKESLEEHEPTHALNEETEIGRLKCNFCENSFYAMRELMSHKKDIHGDKVSACRDFANGTCNFGDKYCWFSHSEKIDKQEVPSFNCRSCEKEFKSQADCLKHRKEEHTNLVPFCRNEEKGTCNFGSMVCWFRHGGHQQTNLD